MRCIHHVNKECYFQEGHRNVYSLWKKIVYAVTIEAKVQLHHKRQSDVVRIERNSGYFNRRIYIQRFKVTGERYEYCLNMDNSRML